MYPPAETDPLSASLYFRLQSMVLLTYIESRYRIGQLEGYEHYSGEEEFPIAPAPTSGLGLAIREFTHLKYAALIEQFPTATSPLEFAKSLEAGDVINDVFLESSPGDDSNDMRLDAARYLEAIRRYFRRFLRVINGWKPPQRRVRRFRSDGGGHGWRSGFVHFTGNDCVYLKQAAARPEDPDFPFLDSQAVWIRLGAESDPYEDVMATTREIERQEDLEELFGLYDPKESKGQVFRQQLQHLAMETRAQSFAFDYVRPTPHELRALGAVLEDVISHYLVGNPTNLQVAHGRCRAALLLKTMLLLGISLDRARQIRFCLITENALAEGDLPLLDAHALLLLHQDDTGSSGQVAGFCVPAITPEYSKDIPEALNEINRPDASALILPDWFGLGHRIKAYLDKKPRLNDRVFGIEPQIARAAVRELMKECGHSRLTPDKIALALPGILSDQGNDQTVTWIVTGNAGKANEPRMHYIKHSVANLQRAYGSSARRIARDIGISGCIPNLPERTGSEDSPSIGARFVIRLEDCTSLIKILKDILREFRRTPQERDGIHRYHDAYLLYSWLMQSMCTSIRPGVAPNQIYSAWDRQSTHPESALLGLSEKDSRYSEKARAVTVGKALHQQMQHYARHFQCLKDRLGLHFSIRSEDPDHLPFLALASDGKLTPLTPGWVERQLAKLFAPLPANFHRAFLRTELIERGCSTESVDAFMGHANLGERPFGRYSSLDYAQALAEIEMHIDTILDDLVLRPIPSRLEPYTSRANRP
jgi:hypothetical protein